MASAASAANLIVAGGELTGATGVDVAGTLYDVSFVEGTCPQVFEGCNEDFDFAFVRFADATIAAQALLDQVFVDGPLGNFDTDPTLTFGCEPSSFGCSAWIPVSPDPAIVAAENHAGFGDLVPSFLLYPAGHADNTSDRPPAVWARFEPSAVPEPASIALLLIGGFALAIVCGRTRQSRWRMPRG